MRWPAMLAVLALTGCGATRTQTSDTPDCAPAFVNQSDMTSAVLMQKWHAAQLQFVTAPGICLNELEVTNFPQGCDFLDPNSDQARAAMSVWPCQQTVVSEPATYVDGLGVFRFDGQWVFGAVSGGSIMLAASPSGDGDATYEMENVILDHLGINHHR
jgi:hypothetical protein